MDIRGGTGTIIAVLIIIIILLLGVFGYILYQKFSAPNDAGKETSSEETATTSTGNGDGIVAGPGSAEYCSTIENQCNIGTELAQKVCKSKYNYAELCE